MTTHKHWFRSLVTDDHGEFDIGRFALFVLIAIVLGAVPVIIGVSVWAWWMQKPFDPQPLGVAIGSICVGFSTALGALGLYLLGDKRSATAPLAAPNIAQQVNVAAIADPPDPPPAPSKLKPVILPR